MGKIRSSILIACRNMQQSGVVFVWVLIILVPCRRRYYKDPSLPLTGNDDIPILVNYQTERKKISQSIITQRDRWKVWFLMYLLSLKSLRISWRQCFSKVTNLLLSKKTQTNIFDFYYTDEINGVNRIILQQSVKIKINTRTIGLASDQSFFIIEYKDF